MNEFSFTQAGKTFMIKGPDGMTTDQAQAIFKQQFNTGSLTGFKVGDALSAATQAADGLPAAQASLLQNLGSLSGSLPVNTNLNTITAGLGPNALAATGQIQSSLQGQIPRVASLTTGSSSAINGAISGTTSQSADTIPGFGLSPVSVTALTGQESRPGSVAGTALETLTKSVSGVPLQGIDTANFTKQSTALGGIGNLGQNDVTGTLAQANKLVGQTALQFSNSRGVGKYGLDSDQLERTGYVKPGTTAAFVDPTGSNLIDVLKSPTVWTGKDNIKNLNHLVSNTSTQDKIQQDLMGSGLKNLNQLGIPVDKLTPTVLSGLAVTAAKSVPATFAWLTGESNIPQINTVPGGDVKSAFDSTVTNCAFAVKMTTDKIEPALKQEKEAVAAVNTVNSETVKAASQRIIGNDKVPDIAADNGNFGSAKIAVTELDNFYKDIIDNLVSINNTVETLKAQGTISQGQWNTVNEEFQILKAAYNNQNTVLAANVQTARNSLPAGSERDAIDQAVQILKSSTIPAFLKAYQELKQKIADLANKIAT